MKEDFKARLDEFKEYLKNIEYLQSASSVLYWDMRVGIPKKAIPYRGEVLSYLSGEEYKLETSLKMKEFIDYFESCRDLDDITKAMVRNAKKNYERTMKIPEKRYKEYTIEQAASEAAWEDAKAKSDYSIFKPHLKKMIDFNKEFIGYWGYRNSKYDTLLDFYEPGITVGKLDKTFGELKRAIVSLLDRIQKSGVKPDCGMFHKKFTKGRQESFSKYVMAKMGFDFDEGRVDESVHPFTINFDNRDVRITTHYYENEFRSALFSCIHEGGHAIYEQDIPDSLKGTMLACGASMGLHESQSRFYENIIGRSRAFWTYFYPEVKRRFPEFKDVTLDEFYKGINAVSPSLVRTEADELTYSLHIIIRYEIEKKIFDDEVDVDELPSVWNKKYKEYMGIEPENDDEGILQDMHWSGGSFGYFPSYALGNLYGAQFLSKMEKDIPDLYKEIERGNLDIVHQWLKENIHKYGSVYKPAELLKKATGEELTAKYFIDYLNKKYSEIYNL
ncbi:MAG: carboxypeptidase M32 [Clostridiales bacterium]|nr:carboxypeptidase M32 [Clostridiales bacterium]